MLHKSIPSIHMMSLHVISIWNTKTPRKMCFSLSGTQTYHAQWRHHSNWHYRDTKHKNYRDTGYFGPKLTGYGIFLTLTLTLTLLRPPPPPPNRASDVDYTSNEAGSSPTYYLLFSTVFYSSSQYLITLNYRLLSCILSEDDRIWLLFIHSSHNPFGSIRKGAFCGGRYGYFLELDNVGLL